MKGLLHALIKNTTFHPVLLVLMSLIYFVGLGKVHLFDWDEINFAESAREMIVTGDYLRVQINYAPFWEKPPLFFWLQVLSMKIFGIHEFAARFPNALFGIIYALTLYYVGKKHFSASFGLLWAFLFYGTLLPHIYFKSGIIDPVFNYFIFLSVYGLIRVLGSAKAPVTYAIYSGIFSAASVLTKGPVGFLLLALCLGVYVVITRGKNMPRIKDILLFLLGFVSLSSIWLGAELWQNGTENLLKFIEYQLDLFNNPVAGHGQPFYYHFLVVFVGCFPISVFALPAFTRKHIQDIPLNFGLWMQILFWVVMILFSLSTTKIIHYSSMTYLPLSFLAAHYVYSIRQQKAIWYRWQTILYVFLGIFWSVLFFIVPLLLSRPDLLMPYIRDDFAIDLLKTPVGWSGYECLTGIFFLGGCVISWYYLKYSDWSAVIATQALTMVITLLVVSNVILPKIEAFTQGPAVRFLSEISEKDAYVESYGYKSYAQYFYSKRLNTLRDHRLQKDWLLYGDNDKPVYLISKSTNLALDTIPGFRLIGAEGGFRFYRKEASLK